MAKRINHFTFFLVLLLLLFHSSSRSISANYNHTTVLMRFQSYLDGIITNFLIISIIQTVLHGTPDTIYMTKECYGLEALHFFNRHLEAQ
ncbi:hypothetical protein CLU79DRAFT_759427 [Phycomyces nitens]|nr:hypothetical protein CLU79DRAFT_759427 [Phycomyces nitens]